MPGFLLHVGAVVQCMHGGAAQPTMPSPRVRVMGQPVLTLGAPHVVSACPFPPPPAGNGPCVTANWLLGAVRVKSMGVPVLLSDAKALCIPSGTGLLVAATQLRVKGQ